MAYRVIYSQRAKSDLANIERYIWDAGSPANAKTLHPRNPINGDTAFKKQPLNAKLLQDHRLLAYSPNISRARPR